MGLGGNGYPFAGDYEATGCYTHSHGPWAGKAWYGFADNGEEVQKESQLTEVESPMHRLPGTFGCQSAAASVIAGGDSATMQSTPRARTTTTVAARASDADANASATARKASKPPAVGGIVGGVVGGTLGALTAGLLGGLLGAKTSTTTTTLAGEMAGPGSIMALPIATLTTTAPATLTTTMTASLAVLADLAARDGGLGHSTNVSGGGFLAVAGHSPRRSLNSHEAAAHGEMLSHAPAMFAAEARAIPGVLLLSAVVVGLLACIAVGHWQRRSKAPLPVGPEQPEEEDSASSPGSRSPTSDFGASSFSVSRPSASVAARELTCLTNDEVDDLPKPAPPAQRSYMDDLFDAIDTDKDGVITKTEIQKASWLVNAVKGMQQLPSASTVAGFVSSPPMVAREASAPLPPYLQQLPKYPPGGAVSVNVPLMAPLMPIPPPSFAESLSPQGRMFSVAASVADSVSPPSRMFSAVVATSANPVHQPGLATSLPPSGSVFSMPGVLPVLPASTMMTPLSMSPRSPVAQSQPLLYPGASSPHGYDQ